jgi:hypothetical protein
MTSVDLVQAIVSVKYLHKAQSVKHTATTLLTFFTQHAPGLQSAASHNLPVFTGGPTLLKLFLIMCYAGPGDRAKT